MTQCKCLFTMSILKRPDFSTQDYNHCGEGRSMLNHTQVLRACLYISSIRISKTKINPRTMNWGSIVPYAFYGDKVIDLKFRRWLAGKARGANPEDQSPDCSTHMNSRWTWNLPVIQHLESRPRGFQSSKGSLTSQINKAMLLSGSSCLRVEDEQQSREMCAPTSSFHTRECVHQVNTHTYTFMDITHTHSHV